MCPLQTPCPGCECPPLPDLSCPAPQCPEPSCNLHHPLDLRADLALVSSLNVTVGQIYDHVSGSDLKDLQAKLDSYVRLGQSEYKKCYALISQISNQMQQVSNHSYTKGYSILLSL